MESILLDTTELGLTGPVGNKVILIGRRNSDGRVVPPE